MEKEFGWIDKVEEAAEKIDRIGLETPETEEATEEERAEETPEVEEKPKEETGGSEESK